MKYLSAVLLFLLFIPYQARAIGPTDENSMKFAEAALLATRIDRVYDTLPDTAFPIIHNTNDVQEWINEIVPMFSYEKITGDEKGIFGGFVFPTSVTFEVFEDVATNASVLGRADCLSGKIEFNKRLFSEGSALYEDPDILIIIIHELAHIQGVCWGMTRLDDEMSAQLIALEMAAAMINSGNEKALGPLLSELLYMAMVSARYAAIQENNIDAFFQLENQLYDSFESAPINKRMRYRTDLPEEDVYIMKSYNYVPIAELVSALKTSECDYNKWTEYPPIPSHSDYPCIHGVNLPINMGTFDYPLFVDDLEYVLIHLEDFGRAE